MSIRLNFLDWFTEHWFTNIELDLGDLLEMGEVTQAQIKILGIQLANIKGELSKMTAIQDAVTTLTAEVATVITDFDAVKAKIAEEVAAIKDLTDQVAALKVDTVDPAVLTDLTNQLTVATKGIEDVLNPPVLVPAPADVVPTV